MALPWMGAGYRFLSLLEPRIPRRMLVASQILRMEHPGVLTEVVGREVTTSVEIGAIGRTSIEFRYRIFFGEDLACTGCTTMIVASGEPGHLKPSPVPEALRSLAKPDGGEDREFLAEGLASLAKLPPAGAYAVPMTVRFSDEDYNKHANHSAMARFFEHAREAILADEAAPPELRAAAEQQLQAVLIHYQSETRALDAFEVAVVCSSDGVLDMWAMR